MATVTVDEVRQFLRDYAAYNILLDEVEFSDADVIKAVEFALDNFNALTPMTSFNEEGFPSKWVLLLGVAKHLMTSEAFLQLRNQVTISDGGLSPVGIDDKFAAYMSLRNALSTEWNEVSRDMKQQINMESAYGSVSSGYTYIRAGVRWP